MGKQLKQFSVGVFVIAGIILFIVLYTWFSGRLGLSDTYDVVVYFEDVIGLRIGDPVMVYGLEKGKVKSLEIDKGLIRSVLALDRDVVIPEDSKIAVRSISLLGADRYVKVTPGSAEETADVYYGLSETVDLESMAAQLDSLVAMFKSINLGNIDKIALDLSRNIERNVNKIPKMLEGPAEKIEHLAEKMDSLSALLSGDGTIGKLLSSDELYEEVRQTNQSLKELIEDIKENPKKYINIKVF